ncbi:MAG: hypothetical protein H7039_07315 [Bryobacteraceae bacterium]|nr:hypothetical protein [Bryobacteraceae bacterium]
MKRRTFLLAAGGTAAAIYGRAPLSSIERVDRALSGGDVDRPAISLWHHFGPQTPQDHARRTLEFHKAYRTDLIKVMSDFPYPKSPGAWHELKEERNPFPNQLRALDLIRRDVGNRVYFIETLFNSWNVAEKLSSRDEVRRLKESDPTALLHALDVITTSQIHHAKQALAAGASGILLAVANANNKDLSVDDYLRFSAPFDRRILEAVSHAKINILHLHVDRTHVAAVRDLPAAVVNYSLHVTGISLSEARKQFPERVLMGGIDEVNYRTLSVPEIRSQWKAAHTASGAKFLLSPGCSVPNETSPEDLRKLEQAVRS